MPNPRVKIQPAQDAVTKENRPAQNAGVVVFSRQMRFAALTTSYGLAAKNDGAVP
jgi:hypothetical protein